MHSFWGHHRCIHLPNIHNGRPILEGLQVSPPSEWNICLHSAILHTAPLGLDRNRKICPQFTSFSLHLGLHSFSLLHPCPLSPRLSVSGDLRRAMKSTHVSLTGSSIRAELRVTFTHLLHSDILRQIRRRLTPIVVSITTFT